MFFALRFSCAHFASLSWAGFQHCAWLERVVGFAGGVLLLEPSVGQSSRTVPMFWHVPKICVRVHVAVLDLGVRMDGGEGLWVPTWWLQLWLLVELKDFREGRSVCVCACVHTRGWALHSPSERSLCIESQFQAVWVLFCSSELVMQLRRWWHSKEIIYKQEIFHKLW